ncbi:MAG: response regulator [Myxococcales bacterium]|nr:response regulator [Myxococcales bacterium]
MAAAKIVVVDDDRETRSLLHDVLQEAGYQVIEAQNGLRLISQLHVDRPDVILLDVMMSWIDGFELCRAIKRNPLYRDIPICFISGRDDPGDIRQGMEAGAADYFVKPIDIDRLLQRLAELVSAGARG